MPPLFLLLLDESAGEFATGLAQAKRIAFWEGQGIAVSGEDALAIFAPDCTKVKQWPLEAPAHCLLPVSQDSILVGYASRFVSSWGAPDMKIDRFCGCCNPATIT